MPTLLTPPAIAKALGVKPERVRAWIQAGTLDAFNLADATATRPRYRVSEHQLEKFLETRRVNPKPKRRQRATREGTLKRYW